MVFILLLVAFVALEVSQVICFNRVMRQNHELSKLLASRNLTEYSLSEARLSGIRPEQKTQDPSYEEAWDNEDNING